MIFTFMANNLKQRAEIGNQFWRRFSFVFPPRVALDAQHAFPVPDHADPLPLLILQIIPR
jgi:hypothetical protein